MIIFCEAKDNQLLYLSWILLWFEASSDLKINLDKSELILIGNVVNLNALAVELGCRTCHLPSTYLGLRLGASHKSVAVWDSVEERLRKRLALWKRNYISKGERVTLIKSTLASLPLYQMSMVRYHLGDIFMTDATRAAALKRQFTTFFFIVLSSVPCGILSSLCMGSLGFSLK